ncbi:MAG: 50S ribosomal protein L25/general stress protein Ctc [Pseudomonadota bacterium]|nr:50S ribosomal protein L25/general stress protein Ctc [Pseudomonadota bacterium]
MSNNFSLNAQARDLQGKGASRRLRHQQLVPAVIYGGHADPKSISVQFKDLVKCLESEAFYSHILTINIDGQTESVVLKALQRHPAKGFPMHADFYRVVAGEEITMRVPLHFINQETAVGVKKQGGQFSIIANDVEIRTLPRNLPESIDVDVAGVELGQTLHLSDIKLPEGVTLTELALGEDHDLAIANIHHIVEVNDDAAEEGSAE